MVEENNSNNKTSSKYLTERQKSNLKNGLENIILMSAGIAAGYAAYKIGPDFYAQLNDYNPRTGNKEFVKHIVGALPGVVLGVSSFALAATSIASTYNLIKHNIHYKKYIQKD